MLIGPHVKEYSEMNLALHFLAFITFFWSRIAPLSLSQKCQISSPKECYRPAGL